MAFKKRTSVIHGSRVHGEILALNYDCCGDKPEDGRAASSAFQHNGSPLMSNAFMGARNEAIKSGKETFTVDNKTYKVTGDKGSAFNKGGCGNPTLGVDNVKVQSASAPYKYKNGYAFKAVCMDPDAINYGEEAPDEEMGGGNYTISYDG
tara:strand:- start:276 stop:725 length:450 start_codon:yes stop_codon:yes gene_type:complete